MRKVTSDMSMSLDGFIAGPNDGVELRDAEILEESFKTTGAVMMGRRMFDLGEGPWGDNPPFHMPVFVLAHHARGKLVKEGGTTFTFVTDGIESALK